MVFIPRWEKYRDKKPSGAVAINWNNAIASKNLVFASGAGYGDITEYNPCAKTRDVVELSDGTLDFRTRTSTFPIGNEHGTQHVSIKQSGFTALTIFEIPSLAGEGAGWSGLFSASIAASSSGRWGIAISLGGLTFLSQDNSGNVQQDISNVPLNTQNFACMTIKPGMVQKHYYNGQFISSIACGTYPANTNKLRVGAYAENRSDYYGRLIGKIYLNLKFDSELSADEIDSLYEAPYQILKPRRRYFLLPSAAANSAALSGSAAASADSTATVHADIPLAGLSTTVSHGSGAVSAALPLAGASAAIAGGAAGISAQVSLSAAAIANTLAEAGLSLDALLSGAADTATTGTGNLNATAASAGLAAAGSASARGHGNIVLQATLSGAAISTALAEAGLVSGQALAGGAQSSASAAGTLIQDIPLSGNSHAVASGAGNVSAVLPLSASAASAANMTGGLTVSVDFSAAALAQALAQAGLDATTLSGLAGAGDAATSASGALSVSVPLDGQVLIRAVGSGVLSQGVQAIPQVGRWTTLVSARQYSILV